RALFETAARTVEHRFDLDQASGKIGFGHILELLSPLVLHCPIDADAILLFAGLAARMLSVVGPLSTMRVSGSHTVERMPIWAMSRPAMSSRLVSAWLRGAGPPNRASIACCWASLG